VVCGRDGRVGAISDISVSGETHVAEFDGRTGEGGIIEGRTRHFTLTPEEMGLRHFADSSELVIKSPEDSAKKMRAVLTGKDRGAAREVVLANAAAALWVGQAAADLTQGAARAAEILDSGEAVQRLERLAALSHEPA
jgi:anthranilate phosphoribosyltransferase